MFDLNSYTLDRQAQVQAALKQYGSYSIAELAQMVKTGQANEDILAICREVWDEITPQMALIVNMSQPAKSATTFLEYRLTDEKGESRLIVLGSSEYQRSGPHAGEWMVSIIKPYDPEDDSDSELIGYHRDAEAANRWLWMVRHIAMCRT